MATITINIKTEKGTILGSFTVLDNSSEIPVASGNVKIDKLESLKPLIEELKTIFPKTDEN